MTFGQPVASSPITAVVNLPTNEIAAGVLVPAALEFPWQAGGGSHGSCSVKKC